MDDELRQRAEYVVGLVVGSCALEHDWGGLTEAGRDRLLAVAAAAIISNRQGLAMSDDSSSQHGATSR